MKTKIEAQMDQGPTRRLQPRVSLCHTLQSGGLCRRRRPRGGEEAVPVTGKSSSLCPAALP